MQIICPGFPKTGSKSLALALRQLGYEVHDIPETLAFNLAAWVQFLEGERDSAFIKETYKDVDALVDAPCNFMWNIIFKHFPDSKVILTVRSTPEVWVKSWEKMIAGMKVSFQKYDKYDPFLPEASPSLAMWRKLEHHTWAFMSSYRKFEPFNPECQIEGYLKHKAYIEHTVPKDQLLVMDVNEGWEPLCTFLGKPVPDTPFPRENIAGSSNSVLEKVTTWDFFEKIDAEISAAKKINENIP